MSLVLVTPPAPVVDWPTIKAHLRLESDADLTYVASLVDAATTTVQERLGRSLNVATWDYRLGSDDICRNFDIRLPMPPLVEVVSVSYIDSNDAEQVYAPANYRAFGVGGQGGVRLTGGASWPSLRYGPEAVTIRYRAGYDDVPAPIRQAILLVVGQLWAMAGDTPLLRSETVEGVGARSFASPDIADKALTTAIDRLLAPYRVYST